MALHFFMQKYVAMSTIMFFVYILSQSNADSTKPSAYEVLQQYDFPMGILPKDVVLDYTLDSSTGFFSVQLNTTCVVNHKWKYSNLITGYIKNDDITEIDGVRLRLSALFFHFWVNVGRIKRDGDQMFLPNLWTGAWNIPVADVIESPQCWW